MTRQGHKRRRRVLTPALLLAGVVLAAVPFAATPAAAAVTCTFSAGTAAITMGVGDTATIVLNGTRLDVNGAQCQTATVTNTNTVTVTGNTGSESVTLDLSGGPFTNGSGDIAFNLAMGTNGPAGDSFTIAGAAGADNIVLGANGIDLTDDASADVATTGVENFTVNSGAGDDTVSGGGSGATGGAFPTALSLNGGAGNDTLTGGDAADTFVGGAGNDDIAGSNGADTADYSGSESGVNVDLTAGTAASDGEGGSDTLASIATVLGSPFNDRLHGAASGTDTLLGEDGNDVLVSGAANDTMNGNLGVNSVSYADAPAAVSVDLGAGTGGGAGSGGDTLQNIQRITGSAFADTLTGDSDDNRIAGLAGNDTESGGLGNDTFGMGATPDGSDVLAGGPGVDTVLYNHRTTAITVNLTGGISTNGANGEGDTISGVENATSGTGRDTLVGNGSNNTLAGARGADVLRGLGGNDHLLGGRGADFLAGGAGNDVMNGGRGNDTCRDRLGSNIRISC